MNGSMTTTGNYYLSFGAQLGLTSINANQFITVTLRIITTARTYEKSSRTTTNNTATIERGDSFAVNADMAANDTTEFAVIITMSDGSTPSLTLSGSGTATLETWVCGHRVL
jgi:hypothetical protein